MRRRAHQPVDTGSPGELPAAERPGLLRREGQEAGPAVSNYRRAAGARRDCQADFVPELRFLPSPFPASPPTPPNTLEQVAFHQV